MVSMPVVSISGLLALPLLLFAMIGTPFGSLLVRSAPAASAALELGEQGFWREFVVWGFERTRNGAGEAMGNDAGQAPMMLTPAEHAPPSLAARIAGRWTLDREHFTGEVRASIATQVEQMAEPDRAFAMGMIDQLTSSVVDQFDLILGLHVDGSLTTTIRRAEVSGQGDRYRGSWTVEDDDTIVIRGGGPLSGEGGQGVMRATLAGPNTLDIRAPQSGGEFLIIRLVRKPK